MYVIASPGAYVFIAAPSLSYVLEIPTASPITAVLCTINGAVITRPVSPLSHVPLKLFFMTVPTGVVSLTFTKK